MKCTSIEGYPVVRIDTDEGINGFADISWRSNEYIIPNVLVHKTAILEMDPTNVERVMLRIRNLGGFKPWGKVTSAIEVALWDIAGKALGVPVYKLLGGKVRDKVRVYCAGAGSPFGKFIPSPKKYTPQDYAEYVSAVKALPENYSIIKNTGFSMSYMIESSLVYGEVEKSGLPEADRISGKGVKEWEGQIKIQPNYSNQQITERGLKYIVACVKAMKEVLGDEVGLAVHLPTGNTPQGTLSVAKALEPFNITWMEDYITGNNYPYTAVEAYRLVSINTSTPIHTGEQIYLRQGCKELIERNAIDVLGVDPLDVGGIAELKWIAEYADLYGITIAPHGLTNGPFGCAAMIQMSATLPKNYIAFEMPRIEPVWWELTKGFSRNLIKDSYINVPDRPGLGLELNEEAVRKHLTEKEGEYFFATKGK